MAAVAEEAEAVRLAQANAAPDERKQRERAEQRPDGNESQGVGKLAVILEEQERIGRRADEDVEIGRHPGKAAEHDCRRDPPPVGEHGSESGAQSALADGIHGVGSAMHQGRGQGNVGRRSAETQQREDRDAGRGACDPVGDPGPRHQGGIGPATRHGQGNCE